MSTATLIAATQAMINHPKTGEPERESARRLLGRLLARTEKQDPTTGAGGHWDGRWYGEKYDQIKGLSLTDIAKLIRADIKLARNLGLKAAKVAPTPGAIEVPDPIGTAPEAIKFGVLTEYFSGGGSIDVEVRNIPADWGWTLKSDRWGTDREAPSDALAALSAELKRICRAYNHDGSDAMVDHYDVRFYNSIRTPQGLILG